MWALPFDLKDCGFDSSENGDNGNELNVCSGEQDGVSEWIVVVVAADVDDLLRSFRTDAVFDADDAVADVAADVDDDAFFLLYVRILSFNPKFRMALEFLSIVDEKALIAVAELKRLPNFPLLSIKSDSSFENV